MRRLYIDSEPVVGKRQHLQDQIALLDKLIPMTRTTLQDVQAKLDRMLRNRDVLRDELTTLLKEG